jgi:tetratricopeptide (TPR) repeat protein
MIWTTRRRSLALALAAAVSIAFSPALSAPFALDDEDAIVVNRTLTTLWPLTTPLSPPREGPTAGRPIANLSFAINYAINEGLVIEQGPTPGPNQSVGYRIGNLLLHLCSGLLLFALLQRTLAGRAGDWWRAGGAPTTDSVAAAVTAIWLLHPLQTDAVNYATQRTELLVGFFYLATLYASVRAWDAAAQRPRMRWYAVAVTSCLLGMATKEVMVTAPLIVLLYDRAFRTTSWTALRSRAPFYAALGATTVVLAFLMLRTPRGETVGFHLGMRWYEYLYTQAWAIGRYTQLVFWPDRLSFDYGIRLVRDWRGIPGLLALASLLIATLIAWRHANRWGWFGFLGAWFFLILGPSSSIVPIVTEVAAERRFHLPLVAVILGLAIVVEAARRRLATAGTRSRRELWTTIALVGAMYAVLAGWKASQLVDVRIAALALQVVAGVLAATLAWSLLMGARLTAPVIAVLALLAGTTFARSRTYADDIVLWRDAAAKMPTNPRAWENLGLVILKRDPARNAADAERMFKRSIEVEPGYAPGYFRWATSALQTGRRAEGRALLERAISVNPSYAPALASMGDLLVSEGDLARALPLLEEAARRAPKAQTLGHLGSAYALANRVDDALSAFKTAAELDPTRTDVLRLAGTVLLRSGRAAEAIVPLEEAARREPKSGMGLALLAVANAEAGRRDDAARAAMRAAEVGASDARVMLISGRVMSASGRPTEAEAYVEQAARLAPQDVEVLTELGKAKLAVGKPSDAIAAFKRALVIAPDFAAARAGLIAAAGR